MNNFARKFLTEWRKLGLPTENETFIAAVSGGADSAALLLVLEELRRLKKLNLRFVVAHFNHDLRGDDSKKDLEFVKSLTGKFDFELVNKTAVNLADEQGNLEQNARRARYEFLRETAINLRAYGVLTAHTLNDQAETFLINLLRGGGLSGLSGMKPKRLLEEEKTEKSPPLLFSSSPLLARPLLTWASREDTENYCHSREIEFRYDTMNEDLAFRRVRIRKVLLPLLKDFNPKIVENLAKTALLLQADYEELNALLEENLEIFEKEYLSLKYLKTLSSAVLRRGLRHWLKLKRGDLRRLEAAHFAAIEKLISSRKSGKSVELPNGEKILKEGGNLYFQKIQVEK